MNMKYSSSGMQLTEKFEGCSLKAYQDITGVWSIGYGHTSGVVAGQTCTQEQAEQWLAEDMAWAEKCVNNEVHVPLTQGEFDAVCDFIFNLGVGSFEHSTLLRLINAGDYESASQEFDKWDKAGGKVVAGLLRRRQAETDEFKAGIPT